MKPTIVLTIEEFCYGEKVESLNMFFYKKEYAKTYINDCIKELDEHCSIKVEWEKNKCKVSRFEDDCLVGETYFAIK